jgi:hypothetical protein
MSYLLTFKWVFCSRLQWGPINEEESDAETFGSKDWLVNDNDMIPSSLPPTALQLLESLMALEVPPSIAIITPCITRRRRGIGK